MIARMWHGRVPLAKADAYEAYLAATGLADYRATPGNRGAWLLRNDEGEVAHFTTLTLWDSMEAIVAFAGPDVDRARYYPEDDAFLLERETHVRHFRVVGGAEQDPSTTDSAG